MKKKTVKKTNYTYLLVLLICILLISTYLIMNPTYDDFETKKIIEERALEFMQAILDGDVETLANQFTEETYDLGGGFQNDGKVHFEFYKEDVRQYMDSDDFKLSAKKLTLENTLKLNETRVYNYDEIMDGKNLKLETFGFKLQEGDYLIIMPPQKNSYFRKGFVTYYRMQNGAWKIIATM